jgi:hypothetical protein
MPHPNCHPSAGWIASVPVLAPVVLVLLLTGVFWVVPPGDAVGTVLVGTWFGVWLIGMGVILRLPKPAVQGRRVSMWERRFAGLLLTGVFWAPVLALVIPVPPTASDFQAYASLQTEAAQVWLALLVSFGVWMGSGWHLWVCLRKR